MEHGTGRDPTGDDHGPGGYSYPTDAVFSPGVFDVTRFAVEEEERYLKFVVGLAAPVRNHWDSPINLSLQAVDIYIDTDPGMGTGARLLLEGRNAALPPEHGWEFALWVEGWNQKVLVPADAGDRASRPAELSGSPLKVRVDADAGTIVVRLPKEVIPGYGDPGDYGDTLALLSQEGFPSAGVRRVRDIGEASDQWSFGGGSGAVNGTRIVDMVVPPGAPVTQESLLADYDGVSGGSIDSLEPDAFPSAWVLTAE